jgi:hypothetical protein
VSRLNLLIRIDKYDFALTEQGIHRVVSDAQGERTRSGQVGFQNSAGFRRCSRLIIPKCLPYLIPTQQRNALHLNSRLTLPLVRLAAPAYDTAGPEKVDIHPEIFRKLLPDSRIFRNVVGQDVDDGPL